MTTARHVLCLSLLVPSLGAVSGCASSEVALGGSRGDVDTDAPADVDDTGLFEDTPTQLRLVVEPASETAPEGLLLPQTFGPYTDARNITAILKPAVDVSGTASAFIPDPWPGVLPGASEFLDGVLRLSVPATGRRWETEILDGAFFLTVPPGAWVATVFPDAALVPIWTESVDLGVATELTLEAPDGLPVWGQVTTGGGSPATGVTVSIVDLEGVRGPHTVTDDQGWYELRAPAGLATVEVSPVTGSRLPTLRATPIVSSEDGARTNLAWANTGTVAVALRLVDEDDQGLGGMPLSLRSERLDGYGAGNASWSVELTSDSRGFVDVRVPPGAWRLEVGPEDAPRSSRALDGVSITEDIDLGDILVPLLDPTPITVASHAALPLVDAALTCRERIGRQRTFLGRTGEDGTLDLALPDGVLVDCFVSPPSDRDDLAPRRVTLTGGVAVGLTLGPGEILQGQVLVDNDAGPRAEALAVVRVLDDDGNLLAQTLSDESGAFQVRIDLSGSASP